MTKTRLYRISSPIFLILVWYAAAAFINAPLILPYPHSVLLRLFELSKTSVFWMAFLFTFLRVIIAFLISIITGFFSGLLAADSKCFAAFLEFPLELLRVTPVIALILPALFWFSSDIVPVFVSVLMNLPVVITASKNGFEKNPENVEKLFKAEARGFTGLSAFLYIRLPAAMPSLLSGMESSFGLTWKVVAAGEVLSIPRHAAGSLMQQAQVHLESADVLAVTFALIIVSYICQKKISSKNHKKTL